MAYIIKNISGSILSIDGVDLDIGEQLKVGTLSPAMIDARSAKQLQIKTDETTLEERKADVAAIKPFKTGDPAIDG